MKGFKKTLALLLALTMVLALAACGGTAAPPASSAPASSAPASSAPAQSGEPAAPAAKTPQDFPTFIIGVVEQQATDETVARRAYFENYLAPKYNVKFIFSEVCKNLEQEISFIENCADSGANAIIGFRGGTEAYQAGQVAMGLGLAYAYNGNRGPASGLFEEDNDLFGGSYGSSVPLLAAAYKRYLLEAASADGSEGFLLLSGEAPKGNQQHTDLTVAALQTISELYGVTYNSDDLKSIAQTDAPTAVPNSKDLNIFIYPGMTAQEGWLAGVSAALQTGKYGMLVSAIQSYSQTSVVVEEVENAFDFNIKVMSIGSLGAGLTTAMNTNDKFGNPSLDFVAVSTGSIKSAGLFAIVYNVLTGYRDILKGDNDEVVKYEFDQFFLTGPEQLEVMLTWDSDATGKWAADYELVDGMLGIFNPDLNQKAIQEHLNVATTFEDTYRRLEGN